MLVFVFTNFVLLGKTYLSLLCQEDLRLMQISAYYIVVQYIVVQYIVVQFIVVLLLHRRTTRSCVQTSSLCETSSRRSYVRYRPRPPRPPCKTGQPEDFLWRNRLAWRTRKSSPEVEKEVEKEVDWKPSPPRHRRGGGEGGRLEAVASGNSSPNP